MQEGYHDPSSPPTLLVTNRNTGLARSKLPMVTSLSKEEPKQTCKTKATVQTKDLEIFQFGTNDSDGSCFDVPSARIPMMSPCPFNVALLVREWKNPGPPTQMPRCPWAP